MAKQPKRVIVQDLPQALLVLAIAKEMHTPVLLQSAQGALSYAGSLYLKDMFAQALACEPEAKAGYIIDCSDNTGLALGALADGHKHLLLACPAPVAEKIASIAAQHGATLHTPDNQHLELQSQKNKTAALKRWLA